MAVNTATSTQLAAPNIDDVVNRSGRKKHAKAVLTFAASSDIGSSGKLLGIPWDCVPDPLGTLIEFTAFGASCTLNIGAGGPTNPASNVAASQAIATAGNIGGQAMGLHAAAKHTKRLWELAGYTKSPGGLTDLTFTIAGANSAAGGTIAVTFGYSDN